MTCVIPKGPRFWLITAIHIRGTVTEANAIPRQQESENNIMIQDHSP